jgi:transcriptional regulator with XRE-family HTH domain
LINIVSAAQCRAARALLNWSQPDLATICGVHVQTISAFENETSTPTKTTLQKISSAFEDGGIDFLPDSGVRLAQQNHIVYQGYDRYQDFYKDVYNVAQQVGGDFCVSNVNERDFIIWHGDELSTHVGRMEKTAKENPNFRMRLLSREGDTFMPAKGYATYRWIPDRQFRGVPFYVYGDRFAILIFDKDDVYISVIRDKRVADAYRAQFDLAWDTAIDPYDIENKS